MRGSTVCYFSTSVKYIHIWAYIWVGLQAVHVLSEGYLCLRFGGLFSGGLIFRRVYFWEGLLPEFYSIYNRVSSSRLSYDFTPDQASEGNPHPEPNPPPPSPHTHTGGTNTRKRLRHGHHMVIISNLE